MYNLEFIHAGTGAVIAQAARERGLPVQGSEVVLEHAALGPVRYLVTHRPQHWYKSRTAPTAKADQYTGTGVKIYVLPINDQEKGTP